KYPELLPVGGLLLLETAVDQTIAQRRLAHAVIAHQHDLPRRVMDRARGGRHGALAQQNVEVQLPEVDQPGSLVVRRAWFRAGGGEQRQRGVEGERGNPTPFVCWLLDDRDRLPRLAT